MVVERGAAAVDQGQDRATQMRPVFFPEEMNRTVYQKIKELLEDSGVKDKILADLQLFIFEENPDLRKIVRHYGLKTWNKMVLEGKSAEMTALELYNRNVKWGYPADLKMLNIIDDLVTPLAEINPRLAELYEKLKQ